jgi:hypothetical protein
MKHINLIATILIIAGALNWGLVGLFDFDLIGYIFGQTWIDRLLFILMGLSAIYKIVNWQAGKSRH